MKKYDIFLFDADNTLYNFDKASAHAIKILFEECGYPYTEHITTRFLEIGIPLWKSYEKGEMSDKELQKLRFATLLGEQGIQHDPVEFNAKYLYALGSNPFLMDDALEICRNIVKNGKQLFIITNGFLASQETRMQFSPIREYISGAFVSEVVGHKKPSTEYFDYVLSSIPPMDREKILVVGDSLSADIAGGNGAGIDTCWFNVHRTKNPTEIIPTYEINKLSELQKFI